MRSAPDAARSANSVSTPGVVVAGAARVEGKAQLERGGIGQADDAVGAAAQGEQVIESTETGGIQGGVDPRGGLADPLHQAVAIADRGGA